ncbi:MAG: hypothetical protein IT204_01795 [Fimbriimonadaceae bacterium]|nr:hypothetical protein [Fimbriimonadaceae bacterium]
MPAPLRVAVVSIRRPIFRGDQDAVWQRSVAGLERLLAPEGVALTVLPTAVTDPTSAADLAIDLGRERPDLVLLQATTFATADLYAPLLSVGRPTGLWAVPEPDLGGPLPLNSLCGVNFIRSLDRPHDPLTKWFYGWPEQPAFRARLLTTVRALRALRRLRQARVLAIGGTAPTFERFALDSETVAARFGCQVDAKPLELLFERVARVREPAALDLAAELSAGLAAPLDDPTPLLPAARLELGLRELALASGYDAVALRCWPELPERCGAMPCAAVARLFDDGCPTACEGDLLGALSCLALAALSGRDPILMDLSHQVDEQLIFWHCGNGPRSQAAGGQVTLQNHFNRPDTPLVRQMVLAPGDTTMLRFVDDQAAAVFDGVWAAAPAAFEGVSGWLHRVTWNGEVALSPADLIATVLDRRLPHHYAFAPGQWADEAMELAAWLGLRLIEPSPHRPAARREAL